MHLGDYTDQVRRQLTASAVLGDERTRQIAEALSNAGQTAVRLAILDALAAASMEITTALHEAAPELVGVAVTVQLDGDQPRFVVVGPPPEPAEASRTDDGEANARISLRLAESLKADIERAASRADVSVNSWLVRAASTALRGPAPTGWPAGPDAWSERRSGRGAHRITGWVTG